MIHEYDSLTLRQLEAASIVEKNECALNQWYNSIRDTVLGELAVGDLARAIRQQLFPDVLVPIAIGRLRANPELGELYDGELLVSLRSVSTKFWNENVGLREMLVSIINQLKPDCLDDESVHDIEVLKSYIDRR